MAEITTTNYALLGLLALRSWSAYELVGQSQRMLRFLWPRAESKVYESAKRLVTLGLASCEHERVGRRRRTVYAITPDGRRALRDWLARPGSGPALEFEGAIKLFFADLGSQDDALATIDEIRAWAQRMGDFGAALSDEYVASEGGPFPGRLHVNALVAELLWRHLGLVQDWAEWAREQVLSWEGTGPQPGRHDRDMRIYHRTVTGGIPARDACPGPAATAPPCDG